MNLKEIKSQYEEAVKIKIAPLFDKDVKLFDNYDLDKQAMQVVLVKEDADKEAKVIKSQSIYDVVYDEQKRMISASAISKDYKYDNFGIAVVVPNPLFIDEQFMVVVKNAIEDAMQNYDAIIKDEKAKQEAAKAEEDKKKAEPVKKEPSKVVDADPVPQK